MGSFSKHADRDEPRLWALALGSSAILNGAMLAWFSIASFTSELARKNTIPAPQPTEQIIKIFPEILIPAAPQKTALAAPEIARTSPDQESAEPPASRRYIGERNTQATSDLPPTGENPTLPSQAGREPRPQEAPATTESQYQDGKLESPSPATPPNQKSPPEMATPPAPSAQPLPPPEKLLTGPNPIESPVPKSAPDSPPKPKQEPAKSPPKPAPAPLSDPAFRGNHNKTAIRGSISRHGRSALDVTDSPMGRYQSTIGRAVEKQWQLNCVKRRDFIVPGFLTVRFFVQPNGNVKSVQFVGDIEGGEVQKGFTLQSIRDAPIPPMPPAVKKEMDGDALELIFNFYF